ncbi:phosphoglycerate kinase [Candidatus Peregrinibacteria bacterium RIFOXYA12_FULL_33_12]|nr:MAG: phosphoglycerate kinase [Candidatus Peregrinibacteria bacterium RIFOXYA12_FULL_33_12]
MNLKSVNLKNKRVWLRVDFNVPVDSQGLISDNTRIMSALPTIKYLLKKGAKQIILATHFGRPKGQIIDDLRVGFIAKYLEKILKETIWQSKEVAPKEIPNSAKIAMLENVRFDPGEEKNDEKLAKAWAKLADIYVNDAFGCSHRAHASIVGIAKLLPSYAGLLLQREIEVLTEVLDHPQKPLTLIIGGAKIDTKIGVLKEFIHKADNILVGGGIANTFLFAQGFDIGKSLYQEDKLETAQEIMLSAEVYKDKFVIPSDAVVASEMNDKALTLNLPVEDVEGDMKILDIGKTTLMKYLYVINKSAMIIWNGPLGLFECECFAKGTKKIAEALAIAKGKVIIGGGETIDALKRFKIDEKKFYHVSTGGGAMLEFLEGRELPGVKALAG